MDELTILIADDHPLVRRGVRDLLASRAHWRVVGEACDGADAVRQAEALLPDVAILDFSMPRMNGPESSLCIAEKSPGTAVVVLTMHDSDEVIHEVLRSGARALVLKSDADRTLLNAVEAVADKRHFFTARVSEVVLENYLGGETSKRPVKQSVGPCLTDREEEVMQLLADGLTSKETASLLRISPRTVESHRININRKLGLTSIAELVRYAIRNGIVSAG